jgi:hypothetical protein
VALLSPACFSLFLSPPHTLQKCCNEVRQSLVYSGLHYFIEESPHSNWITIRKKFICNQQDDPKEIVACKVEDLQADYSELEEKHKQLEQRLEDLETSLKVK